MIFEARFSFLFQLPAVKEYNWIALKPRQVLIPTSKHLKKRGWEAGRVAAGKCRLSFMFNSVLYEVHARQYYPATAGYHNIFWNKKSKLLTDRKMMCPHFSLLITCIFLITGDLSPTVSFNEQILFAAA